MQSNLGQVRPSAHVQMWGGVFHSLISPCWCISVSWSITLCVSSYRRINTGQLAEREIDCSLRHCCSAVLGSASVPALILKTGCGHGARSASVYSSLPFWLDIFSRFRKWPHVHMKILVLSLNIQHGSSWSIRYLAQMGFWHIEPAVLHNSTLSWSPISSASW